MSKPDSPDAMLTELGMSETAAAELSAAVQSAIRFLKECVEGTTADASVADRIAAAKAVLEYAVKQPDMLGELADMAGQVRDEDAAVLLAVLD